MAGDIVQTTGTIKAVYGSPGPASGITYDVVVNVPDVGPKTITAVRPHNNRPPNDYDTIGARVGTVFAVFIVGGVHQYLIYEFPDSAECA